MQRCRARRAHLLGQTFKKSCACTLSEYVIVILYQAESDQSIPPLAQEDQRGHRLPAVRILIVDDDRAICDYMQTLLERDGYKSNAERPTLVGRRIRQGGYHLLIPRLDDAASRRHAKCSNESARSTRPGGRHLYRLSELGVRASLDEARRCRLTSRSPSIVDEFREVLARRHAQKRPRANTRRAAAQGPSATRSATSERRRT